MIATLLNDLPGWARDLVIVAAAASVALLIHAAALFLLARAARHTATSVDDIALRRLRRSTRWLLVAIAVSEVQPLLSLTREGLAIWRQAAGLVMPGLVGWLAIAVLGTVNDVIATRTDINVPDNLVARRRRTRTSILYRIALFVIVAITTCLMLMSIPSIRSVGVTLIASAGLAALAVGAAAQPALKNLIGGLQMALTEPIRIDDVVIVEGEWGRIEDIRLTYVVVRIWDERRLIVPVSQFLEKSFQNWTRETSALLGSVLWYVDPCTDVPRLRAEVERIVRDNPRWDGRFVNLQVTDTKVDAIELRALVTAKDASTAFDLRCDVREGLLAFIREEMPDAIARRRVEAAVQPAAALAG